MSTCGRLGACVEIKTLAGDMWKIEPSEQEVIILPTVHAPLRVQAHGSLRRVMRFLLAEEQHLDDSPEGRTVIGIEATYNEELRHYMLDHLSVSAPEGGEVTGVLLREVAPQRIMRWALAQAVRYSRDDDGAPYISTWACDYLAPGTAGSDDLKTLPIKGGPTAENIKAVSEVYRIAEAIRDAPAKAVADTMGLQQRTATNWINRAREEGLLNG